MTSSRHRPKFLSVDEVLLLHELAIAEFGGRSGVRDLELLTSAVAQPQSGVAAGYVHNYPYEMAAAYGFHLAKNHPFVDGNKRVAWSAVRVFLHKNGYVIRLTYHQEAQVMVDLAAGRLDKVGLAKWIEQSAVERPKQEMRDFFAQVSFEEFRDVLIAIADSYRSGGAKELTAIVDECGGGIPLLHVLKELYIHDREANAQAIHYIHTFCAIYRLAEAQGYEW